MKDYYPYFSIVIPTYNRGKYIKYAINSILKQTYSNYEIILVDDGSSDDTREVIKEYIENGTIKYIYINNSGVSSARNTGIHNSIGDWVAFLDSDDEWAPTYLEYQCRNINKNPMICAHMCNSEIVEISGRRVNIFNDKNIISIFNGIDALTLVRPLYFVVKYRLTILDSIVINRAILLKTGLFDESISIGEDLDIIIKVSCLGSIAIYKEVLVYIIRRQESIDNLTSLLIKKGIYSYTCLVYVYKNVLNIYDCTTKEKKILCEKISYDSRTLGNLYLRMGDIKKSRNKFKESFIVYKSKKSFIKYILSLFPPFISKLFIKGKHIIPY